MFCFFPSLSMLVTYLHHLTIPNLIGNTKCHSMLEMLLNNRILQVILASCNIQVDSQLSTVT